MNYHLNQQGQTVGVFPLEELRRRRAAGQLTGREWVWCEGMPAWLHLDEVLQRVTPAMTDAPPPLSPRESKRVFVVTVVAIAAAVLAGFTVFAIRAYKALQRFQRDITREVTASAGGGSVLEEASKPLQWTTNTITHAAQRPMQRALRIRQYVDAYEMYNDHHASYDADARWLTQAWIDSNYGGPLQTNYDTLAELSDKIAANPDCDDPLVWTVLGANINEMYEQVRRFDRAVKGYEHSRYKAYPRLYASVMLARTLAELQRDPDRTKQLDYNSKKLLKEALQDGSIRPEDQAEFAEILLSGWGNEFFWRNQATIPPIISAAGKPYQWLALMTEGQKELNAAWAARGSGYANTVKPEGWKGFREHLAKARQNFTQAWELRPDLGYAASCMVYVSMADSGISEMRLWFDRTMADQIDFNGAWNYMRFGLRPRWYGNLDSMLAFGVMAADTKRYDTDVPRNLFYSISDMEDELKLPTGQHIYGREDIWPHLQEMYEGYIAEPSEAKNRDGWRTTYSIIAFLAGKLDLARTQLEAIHWNPWRGNFENWGRDLSLMPLEVAARTGTAAQQVNTAESDHDHGDLAGALQLYQQVSADASLDEHTRAYARERLATIGMEQRLKTGDWVDFLPDSNDLTGWNAEFGKFSRTPDGALEVASADAGHIIFARVPVGDDFEVKGRFEILGTSNDMFQGGIVYGLPQFNSRTWYGFRIKRNRDLGDVACFAEGWSTSQLIKNITLDRQANTFDFSIHHCLVTARVNDQTVFENAAIPDKLRFARCDSSFLGFGAYGDANQTLIRYRDVQVRRLLDADQPASSPSTSPTSN